jgi:16S rRNA (cytosine967-C5)-methyltransferase
MTALKLNADGADQLNGREAAFEAIHAALRREAFAGEVLGKLRRGRRLEGREAALATEIAFGALRHAVTIEHVLGAVARFDQRRLDTALRAILLAAAHQIIWLDRIPEFAAVDEAVEHARRRVGGRAARMVNAVLRNLTRAIEQRRTMWRPRDARQVRVSWGEACTFTAKVLPDPDEHGLVEHLAAATGERPARYHTLVERFGAPQAEQIAWAAQAVPPIMLQRNVLRLNAAVFQTRVRAEYGDAAEWTPDVAILPPATHVAGAALFREGRAYVQDTTAHSAALLLEARRGERVLDLCAAPGGKSIVLAQQMGDCGEIVACDAAPDRIGRLQENIRRLRLTSVRTHLIGRSDASESELSRTFDAVLVDVPCSNTGVIARRPEARFGLTAEKLESLRELQAALLRHAAARVRPGGRLVYSTCSIEPEENDQIVAAFLAENPLWEQRLARLTLPAWGPRLSDYHDGGFAALLTRRARA